MPRNDMQADLAEAVRSSLDAMPHHRHSIRAHRRLAMRGDCHMARPLALAEFVEYANDGPFPATLDVRISEGHG